MAEALVNHRHGERFVAESAGLEPGTLNPLVVTAMAEEGIDISHAPTRSVWDVFKAGESYGYVVTVCDDANAERCPIFPGNAIRDHWDLPDPSQFAGTPEEQLAKVREIREAIAQKVTEWAAEKIAAL